MRSDDEVATELAALHILKQRIPQRTLFGDDNLELINAEIEVLTDRLDESECSRFLYREDDELLDEPSERVFEIEHSARKASEWLFEETDEKPSDGWQQLVEARYTSQLATKVKPKKATPKTKPKKKKKK